METKKSHGKMLEPKMREAHQKLSALGFDDEHFEIIFHKYLTTPAEFRFLSNEIEEIHQFADIIQKKVANFLSNAKIIVAEGERNAMANSSLQEAH
jgi:hypothetical protein